MYHKNWQYSDDIITTIHYQVKTKPNEPAILLPKWFTVDNTGFLFYSANSDAIIPKFLLINLCGRLLLPVKITLFEIIEMVDPFLGQAEKGLSKKACETWQHTNVEGHLEILQCVATV